MQHPVNVVFLERFCTVLPAVTPPDSDSSGNTPALDNIAARLRTLRLKSGARTDAEFAKMADVSRASMSQYLTGKQVPRAPVLYRLAETCGVDIAWLLGEEADIYGIKLPAGDLGLDEIFDKATLDAPANFYLLLISIQACREFHEKKNRPSLREALKWVAGPYALHGSINDFNVNIVQEE